MAITEQDVAEAEARMAAMREGGYATKARYDRHRGRIVVRLNSGVEVTFPSELAEGLAALRRTSWARSRSALWG